MSYLSNVAIWFLLISSCLRLWRFWNCPIGWISEISLSKSSKVWRETKPLNAIVDTAKKNTLRRSPTIHIWCRIYLFMYMFFLFYCMMCDVWWLFCEWSRSEPVLRMQSRPGILDRQSRCRIGFQSTAIEMYIKNDFWPGDLDLWTMTLPNELDLDILPLDLPAKIQVCVSVRSHVRARHTDGQIMSKLLHQSLTWGVII